MADEAALQLQRINAIRRMLDRGASLDDALAALRADGCTIMESIKVIRTVAGLSLSEAKDLIHSSRAWSDVGAELKASHERLFDEVWRSGELISREDGVYLRIRLSDDQE